MVVGAYTVHFRRKGDQAGETHSRLCESPEEALAVARAEVDRGGHIAFIDKGGAVWMTAEQIKAKLEKRS